MAPLAGCAFSNKSDLRTGPRQMIGHRSPDDAGAHHTHARSARLRRVLHRQPDAAPAAASCFKNFLRNMASHPLNHAL